MNRGITVPSIVIWILVAVVLLLIVGKKAHHPASPTVARSTLQYVLDTSSLAKFRDSIAVASKDSIRAAVNRWIRNHQPRVRASPSVLAEDSTRRSDTVCLAVDSVRMLIVADSSIVVSRDSARNVLAERDFDVEALRDSLERREPSGFIPKAASFTVGALAGIIAGAVLWGTMAQ